MAAVSQTLASGLVVMLTAALGAGAVFAPEHVHARDEHHPDATIHRHLAPHQVHRSHDPAHFEDDDDAHVIWLTAAWLQSVTYHVPDAASLPAIVSPVVPVRVRWTALVLDDAAPPHGPPRASRSLRAPPLPA